MVILRRHLLVGGVHVGMSVPGAYGFCGQPDCGLGPIPGMLGEL